MQIFHLNLFFAGQDFSTPYMADDLDLDHDYTDYIDISSSDFDFLCITQNFPKFASSHYLYFVLNKFKAFEVFKLVRVLALSVLADMLYITHEALEAVAVINILSLMKQMVNNFSDLI